MEVTSLNFPEVLEELDDVLKNATFLGIDGEFTGLNSGPDAGPFDTPAQYYAKLRAGSMDFLLIQFGLSVFTFNAETQKYNQRSYNFYVFPRPLNRTAPDCRFMCQASCITFLASQGFDFNKLFNLGIPYLTSMEEEKLMKRLEEKQKLRDETTELVPIPDSDKLQIEDICTRIDQFINSEAEELTIDKCNAFIRRLVHQEVKVRWPNKLKVETRMTNFECTLVVQRSGSKEEEHQKETERRQKEKAEVQQAVGLSLLMRKIADSGKLIVGHNMLLDLCHMVHQFFGHLPESYQEFKSLLHGLFPRLLDTKVICHSQQFKENVLSSNLGTLLERVSKSPFKITEVVPVDDRSYSTLTDKCHEAGYDAYITGICFIALSNYLGSLQDPEVQIVLADSPLLKPFLNKLLIGRLKDMPYINLVGDDPSPSRDHVFHLTFPKEWKFNDITQLFSPFGGVQVSWLNDTSAYVGLMRREQANAVIKGLNKGSMYKIQKYADYQATLETNVVSGERKRKLSSCEAVPTRKEGNSVPTKTAEDDNGWKVATGNDLELSSNSIIPCTYPRERSRATSGLHGSNHDADETLVEQMKVLQKIRLKNRKKDVVPKHMILKRNAEIDSNCKIDNSRRKSVDIQLSNVAKSDRHNCKLGKIREHNQFSSTQTVISKSIGKKMKHKEYVSSVEFSSSSKEMSGSSLSVNLYLKNHTKQHSKIRPIIDEIIANCTVDEVSYYPNHTIKNDSECFVGSSGDQIEQRFNKNRSVFVMLIKILAIIFFYYVAINAN